MGITSDLNSVLQQVYNSDLKASKIFMNKRDYEDILGWSNQQQFVQQVLEAALQSGYFTAEQAAHFVLNAEKALEMAHNEVPQIATFEVVIGNSSHCTGKKQTYNLAQAMQIIDDRKFKILQWPEARNLVIVYKVMEA
jgi:hypothetical protein